MRISSLLSIFDTMLETAVIVRAQFMMSRAYGDIDGMREALEMSLAVDQDLISILNEAPFEVMELGARERFPSVPGTPEEIIEMMKKVRRLQTASISNLLRTVPGDIPELEERRREIANHKMDAVGNFFRRMKRILKEQWHFWKPSHERMFGKMLKLRAPRKK